MVYLKAKYFDISKNNVFVKLYSAQTFLLQFVLNVKKDAWQTRNDVRRMMYMLAKHYHLENQFGTEQL